jgi:acyl-CoA synthetase (AMP-forming)/AMP-acid ligase II
MISKMKEQSEEVVPNAISRNVDVETGALLEAGQPGELCVSGPQVMLCYSTTWRPLTRPLIRRHLGRLNVAVGGGLLSALGNHKNVSQQSIIARSFAKGSFFRILEEG